MIDESDPRVCQIGHPAPPWLVNYADLMTELVCFFVILYALSAALNKNVQNAREQVEQMMKEGKMEGEVKVDKEGLKIDIQEQERRAFFESGSAELTAEMESIIDKLAPILRVPLADKNELIIEGHTDNVPIDTEEFASNWELSTARATEVVKRLTFRHRFPPQRIAAIGYGEHRPKVAHPKPKGDSQNRRVVFFVKMGAPALGTPPPEPKP